MEEIKNTLAVEPVAPEPTDEQLTVAQNLINQWAAKGLQPVIDHKSRKIRLEAVNPKRRAKKEIQSKLGLSGRQWKKQLKAYNRLTDEQKQELTNQLRSESNPNP